MGARIEEHPILGKQEKGRLVTFYFDGKELTGYEGEPIAAALKAQGVMIQRYTKIFTYPSFGPKFDPASGVCM